MHWQGFGSCHLRWHAWERRLSLAHLRGCCCYMLSSSLLLSPHLYSWERKLWQKPAPAVFSTSPLGQPPGVCSLSLSHSVSDWHTNMHIQDKHTQLDFLFSLLAWKWADGQRKCVISRNGQSERTWLIGWRRKLIGSTSPSQAVCPLSIAPSLHPLPSSSSSLGLSPHSASPGDSIRLSMLHISSPARLGLGRSR